LHLSDHAVGLGVGETCGVGVDCSPGEPVDGDGEFDGVGRLVGAADGSGDVKAVGEASGSGTGVIDAAGIAKTGLSLISLVVNSPIPIMPAAMIRIAVLFNITTSLFAVANI
jgi:hypothetical protein